MTLERTLTARCLLPGMGSAFILILAAVIAAVATISMGAAPPGGTTESTFAAVNGATPGAVDQAALQAPASLAQSTQVDGLVVMMTISPGSAGQNEMTLMYFAVGPAPQTAHVSEVRLSFLDYSDVQYVLAPTESHPGHAYFGDLKMQHAGRWRVETSIAREGAEDASVAFDLTIGGPAHPRLP